MYVVATAGHVDHGKSTLVRALTGMEPDRWAEERRRGMTIDLGFAWTELPTGESVAFVDVPGHERFVGNMLAGVGSVPAVLFVVAADEGWKPQSTEHLDALDALGVERGLLVVTRSDLADPQSTMDRAMEEIGRTTLATLPAVAVSAQTGQGMDELREALHKVIADLPAPSVNADVRLWIDRAFTIRGAGTVVTGTLATGRLTVGAELELGPGGRSVTVRGLQALGTARDAVEATARVAMNLRGVSLDEVRRGHTLLTPGRWLATTEIDVRLRGADSTGLPDELSIHVGAAAVQARVRPLGEHTVRLHLASALPLRIGDVALLRDPGARRIVAGLTVLDIRPPALRRRGSAAARAAVLSTMDGRADGLAELARRGIMTATDLIAMGAVPPPVPAIGSWLLDPRLRIELSARLSAAVADYAKAHPLKSGAPVEVLRRQLGLPDLRLITGLLGSALVVREGRVVAAAQSAGLPEEVQRAVDAVRGELATDPYAAPDSNRLAALGLGAKQLAAAVRSGALLKLADGVFLLPGADTRALDRLAGLPQPFTLSQARQALGTTRRVAVPLLELLASQRRTRRREDGTHEVR